VHSGRSIVLCVPRGLRSGLGVRSALRAGRIFDTPPLKGYTFVNFRLRSSTARFSTTSDCACIRRKQALPLALESE
jgi:hypothetical protein